MSYDQVRTKDWTHLHRIPMPEDHYEFLVIVGCGDLLALQLAGPDSVDALLACDWECDQPGEGTR